jgi:hypothetical protein
MRICSTEISLDIFIFHWLVVWEHYANSMNKRDC